MCYETEPKNSFLLLIIITLWLLHRIFVSKNFFFSFVCWLLNFLRFIKGTNKTDSSLHSMKSVSLILLFYFFFRSLVVQNNNGRFLNNAWRMMNYGQEWHIKKNGLFACLYTFIVDRYLSRNTIYMTKPAWSFIIRLN